jgi:hypothetical protein
LCIRVAAETLLALSWYALGISGAVLLAGCASFSAFPSIVQPVQDQAVDSAGTGNDGPPPSWHNVYVVNASGGPSYHGTVTVYAPGNKNPIRTISTDMEAPFPLTFDKDGNLYVGDVGWVAVYARGSANLLRKIPIGPYDLARWMTFDHAGYLYVAEGNNPSGFGSVRIFAPNSTKVVGDIKKDIRGCWRVATSPGGDIYAGNYNYRIGGWVSVYRPRSLTPIRIIRKGIYSLYGLAVDKSGNTYVGMPSSAGHNNAVAIIKQGSDTISQVITRGVNGPREFAFDHAGNLYVDNCTNACGYKGSITVYKPGAVRPFRTISRGVDSPTGLALDSSDNVYVANGSTYTVTVYAAGSGVPKETITDGISDPVAIAIGP